ncbi:hypothetical protein H4S08_001417 [Coemansia sp. RSA 1365]|nr:hypothetical protein H4S08_001417 [Coemansia sp. RSA 1365]
MAGAFAVLVVERVDRCSQGGKPCTVDLQNAYSQRDLLETKLADTRRTVDELENQHDVLQGMLADAREEFIGQREVLEIKCEDALKAAVGPKQQWDDCWKTMQREHLAGIEQLRVDTQLKPVRVVQLMTPLPTSRKVGNDGFTAEQCNDSADTVLMI